MDFELTNGMAILERTPRALREMVGGLSTQWTEATEGPDTWSPRAVLRHLIHGERTDWIPRARIILDQGPDRRFTPFDRLPGHVEESASVAELLSEFSGLRTENLAILDGWQLTDHELSLGGEHPELGPVTLRQLLATWVAHDLSHTAQIARVMAKQYRNAVGPWRAYLTIVDVSGGA